MGRVDGAEQGWQPDPFGRHDERWMSAGTATELVRDGSTEGHDPPIEDPSPSPAPEAQKHWIDVDRLEQAGTQARRWWNGPRVIAVAATCCSLLITLGILLPNNSQPVGAHETIGSVLFVDIAPPWGYVATYDAPGHPDPGGVGSGMAVGPAPRGSVVQGQSVVVRYDPRDTTQGTVVSLIPVPRWWAIFGPDYRANNAGGKLVLLVLWGFSLAMWIDVVYRGVRRAQEREDRTDYRDDGWGGGTYSA
jgi:hypothetical protein